MSSPDDYKATMSSILMSDELKDWKDVVDLAEAEWSDPRDDRWDSEVGVLIVAGMLCTYDRFKEYVQQAAAAHVRVNDFLSEVLCELAPELLRMPLGDKDKSYKSCVF